MKTLYDQAADFATCQEPRYTNVTGNTILCGMRISGGECELGHRQEPESCEHGLSAWLCAGPGHYPMDREFPW